MQLNFDLIGFLDTYFVLSWYRLVSALITILAFVLFRRILTKYVFKLISKIGSKFNLKTQSEITKAFEKPFLNFFMYFGVYLALRNIVDNAGIESALDQILKSIFIIAVSVGLYNIVGYISSMILRGNKMLKLETNHVIQSLLTQVLKVLIVAFAFIVIVSDYYDVNGFITGLGISGLAIAMAAQDTLASIFAGISIILDKPFDIGDYVKCQNHDGIVEEINFRSTRIRTFSKELITIPNLIVSKEPIINYSKRGNRRVRFALGLTYDSESQQMKDLRDRLTKYLMENSHIMNESVMVRFDAFNDSSLDMIINFYTNSGDYAEYMEIKEEVNFKIIDILNELNLSAAFPSTSVYFENDLNTKTN